MPEQSDEEILEAILAQLEADGACRAAEAAQLHSIMVETMTTLLAIDERRRALDKRLETMPEELRIDAESSWIKDEIDRSLNDDH